MGRVKEMWLENYLAEAGEALARDERTAPPTKVATSTDVVPAEREWAARHPAEWGEWVRLLPPMPLTFDFGSGESYDFLQFLSEVGPRPSPDYAIGRQDEANPYARGNLVWRKTPSPKTTPRRVDSPYLTADEAAAYCRRARRTLLNHHSLGNVRSVPGTRPPLFLREELDKWVAKRRKRRGK